MKKLTTEIRKPVRRLHAERFLLINLLAYAFSISVTRLFLEISGYPQLGNSELHIAHVLWGGLLLFVGALFPLVFANRWAYDWSALFSGVGMGLFIDEVGKFIAQTNDYFYPAAAPIIYSFFLLALLVLVLVRKQKSAEPRAILYQTLERLQEALDQDLSAQEREQILRDLQVIRQQGGVTPYEPFTTGLQIIVHNQEKFIVPHAPDFTERLIQSFQRFEQKYLQRKSFRGILIAGCLLWGIWAVVYPLLSWYVSLHRVALPAILQELVNNQLQMALGLYSVLALRVFGEVLVGCILILAAVCLLMNREKVAVQLANFSLLFSLTVVYVLVFYFDQLSAIFYASIQFLLLLGIMRYRSRFLVG